MNPVAKALWFIESHFTEDLSLDDVAGAASVSRYHMSRVFGAATGCSVVRYVRGRRLTDAARALAAGAPDILAVALDAGYNSHEAFTRAFRDQFGLTPEALRARGNLEGIELMEAIKMDETLLATLEPPRFENLKTLLIAGLSERYTAETCANIPAQWQRFAPAIRRTWFTIWNKWLPESGHQVAEAPEFERYGEEFDPRTGTGGLEIWIPIQS